MRALYALRVAAAATVLAGLAGCTHKSAAAPIPPPAPTSASPSTDPAVAAASAEILDRFRSFRQAYDTAGLTADYKSEDLTRYLEDPLQKDVVAFMLNTKIHGAVYRGEAQSTPTISKIDLKAKTATITECYDTTKFKLYFTKNNSPVPVPSGPRRGIIETLAKDYGGKKGWMFYKSQALTDPTC